VNIGQKGDALRDIITKIRAREYPYEPRPPVKRDWTAYDMAQTNEIADMLELIRVVVDSAERRQSSSRPPKTRATGRPAVPAADIVKVLMLQSYLGVSNRVAQSVLQLLWRNLGLRKPFSYKTIERGYDERAVADLLKAVMELTNLPVKDLETVFGPDGTGTGTRKPQVYADSRSEQRGKGADGAGEFPTEDHDFVNAVAVVGAVYKLVATVQSATRRDIGELRFFEPLMRETKRIHPNLERIVGDGLYAVRPCCNLAEELGAELRSLPRRNASLKRLGSDEWVHMLHGLLEDPQGWLRDYFQREASENVNGVVKQQNPQPLRKRLPGRLTTEDFLRWTVYNVRRLCYLVYLVRLRVIPAIQGAVGPSAS